MSEQLDKTSLPEPEILKKHPNFRYVEGEYKEIQKATRAELEALKKKYEKAIKDHELSVTENRTTIFSDLLSEVEARQKTLPEEPTRTTKIQRLKNAIEGQNKKATTVDNRKIIQNYMDRRGEVITPVTIELSPDIYNDPFWKSLNAYMFKVNSIEFGKYYLCVREKNLPEALCIVEFSQEEYNKRISKDVPINDKSGITRVGKTYGVGEEIRIGI